jgi:hypothetical protein
MAYKLSAKEKKQTIKKIFTDPFTPEMNLIGIKIKKKKK